MEFVWHQRKLNFPLWIAEIILRKIESLTWSNIIDLCEVGGKVIVSYCLLLQTFKKKFFF